MIGLDTNVIVRFLLKDYPQQWKSSDDLIQACEKKQESVFISNIVLCELVWVLQRSYRYPKAMIVTVLENIVFERGFEFENRELVNEALEAFRNSKVDFSDCLIGIIHRHHGCRKTYSFDSATHALSYFEKP